MLNVVQSAAVLVLSAHVQWPEQQMVHMHAHHDQVRKKHYVQRCTGTVP